jgi:hypothetical protein
MRSPLAGAPIIEPGDRRRIISMHAARGPAQPAAISIAPIAHSAICLIAEQKLS